MENEPSTTSPASFKPTKNEGMRPNVKFENKDSVLRLTGRDIEEKLAQGNNLGKRGQVLL